ncbi:Bacterial low temperature requirement A protein (LtrA) [Propionibacterium ruminifibrarum]|uniref:Bacterial low temperature requirement A protein (LtrA) n=1 Tax=Propionibacterium ruminifibrarum TaxID=1962131 RepID=A0A375I6K6_9ACTN|nr:low temperature requirement protein A [Propionibacterium ruminifibrarum]SPF69498.1 Bacterial low temperature requirement A protein (LtrA) [Propionibacterium ruminifibrarum]
MSTASPGDSRPTMPPLAHHRVDEVMLFLDLVYVFAVAGISGVLREGGTVAVLRGVILLAVIYWLWCITSIQMSMRDASRDRSRLVVLLIGLVTLVMAVCVPDAFGRRALAFALSCWAARLLIVFGLVRSTWRVFQPDLVGVVLTGPLLTAGALLGGRGQLVLWSAAALAEFASPVLLRAKMRAARYDAENVVERFGLLVIVALGETLVGVGEPLSEAEHVSWQQGAALVAAFALIAGLWWSYFHHSSGLVLRRLETADTPFDVVRGLLVYGHLLFVGGIIAVAAALHLVFEETAEPAGWFAASLLCIGTVAFLTVFLVVRLRTFRRIYRSRLLGVVANAALVAPAATVLPAWVALTAVAAIVVAVALWETLAPVSAGVPQRDEFSAVR